MEKLLTALEIIFGVRAGLATLAIVFAILGYRLIRDATPGKRTQTYVYLCWGLIVIIVVASSARWTNASHASTEGTVASPRALLDGRTAGAVQRRVHGLSTHRRAADGDPMPDPAPAAPLTVRTIASSGNFLAAAKLHDRNLEP